MSHLPRRSPQTDQVLQSLLAQPSAWRYGYELARETGLKSGTLYPLLIRLHDRGLLEAEWRPAIQAGRPPRHAYRLTDAGAALACTRLAPQTRSAPDLSPSTAKGSPA